MQKYCYSLRKFFGFCRLNDEEILLPLNSLTVAEYLTYLRVVNGKKGAISTALAALKWLHSFIPGINKFNDPLQDEFLSKVSNSAQRALSKPIIRKSPLTGDLVKNIILNAPLDSLTNIRDCLIPVLAYSLLLRHDEMSHVSCSHITISDEG